MVLTTEELKRNEREIDSFMARLAEMGCDAGRIVVSCMLSGGRTAVYTQGMGNMFAQRAMARDWVKGQENMDLKNVLDGEEDDG